jgi:hypothetical protein
LLRLPFLAKLASIGCEPMQQVKAWQAYELTDVSAKVVIHEAFVAGKLDSPNTSPAPCMICISKYQELRFRVLCAFT